MHEKHRQRMRGKTLQNVSVLSDHELLETLLFYALPRVNTNPIAHELIDKFGSLDGVLSAPPTELMKVNGIGESAACFLVTLNAVINAVAPTRREKPKTFTPNNFRQTLTPYFKGKTGEVFVVLFYDENKEIISRFITTDDDPDRAFVDLDDFTAQVVAVKPKYALIAHNHVDSTANPSKFDTRLTQSLCVILTVHKVQLLDHIIVSENDYYSYFAEGRTQDIQRKINKLL